MNYHYYNTQNKRKCREFLTYFVMAIEKGWSNDEGRMAMYLFLRAAIDACDAYLAKLISIGVVPTKNEIEPLVANIGGDSLRNASNSRYAIRKMPYPPAKSCWRPVTFEEKVDAYRNPAIWQGDSKSVLSQGAPQSAGCTARHWVYENAVPDVLINFNHDSIGEFDTSNKPAGLLVGEAKSFDNNNDVAEDQACVHALRGLALNKDQCTASVVMNATDGRFTEMYAENGVIYKKRKEYGLNPNSLSSVGMVDQNAYFDMFEDIVMYMWDTYYMPTLNQ